MTLSGQVLGNYEVGPELGRGGMGVVYRATSLGPGPAGPARSVVALKVFDPALVSDERTFQRFQREAELGMRIDNPHVVATYEIDTAEAGGRRYHFMAMQLVDGQTLRDVLAELGTLPEHLIYQVADQALDALASVHAVGMVHRDVKPENLVLTHEQRLLLMDLGVARLQQEGRDLTRAGEFVGSLPYASPEQFVDQDHVGPPADLYSFGVVLYEIATGRNPFLADDLSALLQTKLKSQVRRPRLIVRDLDPFLDEVIVTCLRSDPGERFASCGELRRILAEGQESAWWKERIGGEAFPAAARALQRLRPPREVALIGRGKVLDRMHGVRERGGGVLLLHGAAGTGKSRLLHDFLEDLVAPDGPLILAGRAPRQPGRAHHAFIEALAGLAPDEARISELIPGMPESVAPMLLALLAGEESDLSIDAFVGAYTNLLRHLSGERPVVLAIEDLHRAGPETVELFGHLARGMEGAPVLLIGSYREEEVEEGSELHAVTASGFESVGLGPFSRADIDELLRAVATHERTVRALALPLLMRSNGNPLVLLEMLAQLRASGGLKESEGGLVLTAPLDSFDLPANIRDLFERRLDALDDDLRDTLEAAAVAGPEFRARLVGAVTGQRRIGLLKKLALLERRHRLIESSGKSAFRFAGQGLHEVVYEAIPEDRRMDLHAQCVDALLGEHEGGDEPIPGDAAVALVRHQLMAHRISATDPHVATAIDHAAAHLHPVVGAAFLDSLIPVLDEVEVRFDAVMRLAELQRLLGRTDQQKRALARASREAEKTGKDRVRARLQAAFAELSWRTGMYERAETEASRGHMLACRAGDRAGEAQCLHILGSVAYRRGQLEECMQYWRDALHVRRTIGDRAGEAHTLQALGMAMRETGESDEGLESNRAALEIFREIGDRRGEGAALNNLGNALVDNQRIEEALVCYEQSVRITRDLGDMPTEASALFNSGRALSALARVDEGKQHFGRALDLFREIGDPSGEAETLDEMGSSIAAFGETPEALECLAAARESAHRNGEIVLLARVLRHLANVQHESGLREEAWGNYDRALGLASPLGRAQTLADMGNAALREGDAERAVELLERCMEGALGGSRTLLALCRLARAHVMGGREEAAQACAVRVEGMIQAKQAISPQYEPEVYFSLGSVLGERGRPYLEKANELLGSRTRSIRSIVHRQHYLTMTWPNREILEEARRLLES